MIEFSHRGISVEQRGNRYEVPALGRFFLSEPQACKAIDAALEPLPAVKPEPEQVAVSSH